MVSHYTPKNLNDALKAIHEEEFLPYAGGTDINSSGMEDCNLIFIGKLPEIRKIELKGDNISIGAGVTYKEAENSEIVPEILKTAIQRVASPAVRNLGTFGGNFANGSGKADCALVNMVLDAKLHICSLEGERFVEAKNFYRGVRNVNLSRDELITEILIPNRDYYINYFYDKISVRRSLAISNITIASVWETHNNRINELSIGIGSATDYPQRCTDVESVLKGKTFEEIEESSDDILGKYITELNLHPDRTCIDYRRQVCFRIINHLITEEFTPIHI